MGRAPCCDKANVKKGPWSPEEDSKLKDYIEKYGTGGNWIALPQKAGLKRCGKSCRLRWLNYLRPNIKHGEFSDDEDRIICSLFASIGSRWSIIAAQLPGRTDNDIKNYWNTKLKKKLMGFVPTPSQRKPPQFPIDSFHTPSSYRSLNFSSSYYTPNRSFPGLENISITTPSSFMNDNNSNASLFQPQESLLSSMHPYHPPVKDNMYIMFGGGEPSCSSSDGSCNQNQISYGKEMECGGQHQQQQVQVPFENYFYNDGGSGWSAQPQRTNCLWGDAETPILDFGIEDIKNIVVANSSSGNSSNNCLFDEKKTEQGKAMYY